MTIVRNPIRPGDGDSRHGTLGGYTNHRCRCELCRNANRQYCYTAAQRRKAAGLSTDDLRHGTENGYGNYGCRCRPCTDVWSAMSARRARERGQAA